MTRNEKMQFGVLVAVLALVVLCGGGVLLVLCDSGREVIKVDLGEFDEDAQPWVECPIEIPDETGRVVFLRRHSHPFLAEYDRKIRYEMGDRAVTKDLPPNTGGKTRINVYYYPAGDGQGPFVRFRDRAGNYYFDLGNDANEVSSAPEPLIKKYIGRLDGTQGPLQFVSAEESPEESIELTP